MPKCDLMEKLDSLQNSVEAADDALKSVWAKVKELRSVLNGEKGKKLGYKPDIRVLDWANYFVDDDVMVFVHFKWYKAKVTRTYQFRTMIQVCIDENEKLFSRRHM